MPVGFGARRQALDSQWGYVSPVWADRTNQHAAAYIDRYTSLAYQPRVDFIESWHSAARDLALALARRGFLVLSPEGCVQVIVQQGAQGDHSPCLAFKRGILVKGFPSYLYVILKGSSSTRWNLKHINIPIWIEVIGLWSNETVLFFLPYSV